MTTKKYFCAIMLSWIIQFFQQLFFPNSANAQTAIELDGEKWKFKQGDDPKWATPQYPTDDWRNIEVGKSWEDALGTPYDGIAWYRVNIVIPKSMRRAVRKYKQIVLRVGKIDDADETYFNGKLVGKTGKFPPQSESAWDEQRVYFVPCDLIKFDKPNTIAIRVADWGGGGGLYGGEFSIEPASWKEKCAFSVKNPNANHFFEEYELVKSLISIQNGAKESIGGVLECQLCDFSGKVLETQSKKVQIPAKSALKSINFDFSAQKTGFYYWNFQLKDTNERAIKYKYGFAVSPQNAVSAPSLPTDFDAFWTKTKAELATVAPNFRIVRKHEKSSDSIEIFEIEFHSYGNKRVRGYYSRPVGKKNLPALLRVQGYSSIMDPHDPNADFAIFYLNIRGHGNSREDVNPGFPGFLMSGLEHQDAYIYRGAFMDCIRAVDFLAAQTEVNPEKIGVCGASQGGALSIATTALDSRIKFCQPDVPFLSDFRNYFQIAEWPNNEIKTYALLKGRKMEDIHQVLDYFDVKNFATKINVPVFMGVGLFDDVCPPAINFAAFNNMPTVNKTFILYPKAGHSMPEEQYKKSMAWIKTQFNKL